MKGDKADPLKVLTRVQKKCGRKVELISPVLKLPEEHKKQEQHQVTKQEEKKLEVVNITIFSSFLIFNYAYVSVCVVGLGVSGNIKS